VIAEVFRMIQYAILSREQNMISEALFHLFAVSPFSSALLEITSRSASELSWSSDPVYEGQTLFFVSKKNHQRDCCGLHLDPSGSWKDVNLAVFTLELFLKYPTREFFKFVFYLAGFLTISNWRGVNSWMENLDLSADERQQYQTYVQFASSRAGPRPVESCQFVVDETNRLYSKELYERYRRLHRTISETYDSARKYAMTIYNANGKRHFTQTLAKLDSAIEVVRKMREIGQSDWQRLWINATAIGAPWHPDDVVTSVRWKRDPCLCAYYCPMKLKANRHFDGHLQASLARVLGRATTAEEIVNNCHQKLLRDYKAKAPPSILDVSDEASQMRSITMSTSELLTLSRSESVLSDSVTVVIR
jgi:hypothetical protein